MRALSWLTCGSLAALSFLLCVPACSDSNDIEPDDEPDSSVDRRDATADSRVQDARIDAPRDATDPPLTDASRDAVVDDADVEEESPEPGSVCSPNGTTYERSCGACGLQTAGCVDGRVTGYGACKEQPPAFCQSDAGDAGAEDAGEDASVPIDAWQGYSIDIDGAVGQVRNLALPQADGQRRRPSVVDRRVCPATFPGTVIVTDYALVRVRNRTAQAASIGLSVSRGQGPTDTILAVYGALPLTDDALLACLGSADRGTCADPVGGSYGLSCLLAQAAPVVPAGAEVYVYVGMATGAWNAPGLSATRIE